MIIPKVEVNSGAPLVENACLHVTVAEKDPKDEWTMDLS